MKNTLDEVMFEDYRDSWEIVIHLFYKGSSMGYSKKAVIYKVPEGVQHFLRLGDLTSSLGFQLLILFRNPYNL